MKSQTAGSWSHHTRTIVSISRHSHSLAFTSSFFPALHWTAISLTDHTDRLLCPAVPGKPPVWPPPLYLCTFHPDDDHSPPPPLDFFQPCPALPFGQVPLFRGGVHVVYFSVCLTVCLWLVSWLVGSLSVSVCLTVCLSVCDWLVSWLVGSLSVSVCLTVCLSVCDWLVSWLVGSLSVSVCLTVCLSVCL